MQKTLLLVFVHGFKGGDDTFGSFPERLRTLVSHGLPKIEVQVVTYPKFETRGDLKETVSRFREWLQNKVIDIEVSHSTPSPTIDPSVHTILLGHSMGGIVAVETLLLLASEEPLPHLTSPSNSSELPSSNANISSDRGGSRTPHFMFPHILAIVAYDTPFLGISPGVIAHGAESHYKTASSAYSTLTQVAGLFGDSRSSSEQSLPTQGKKPIAALPAPSTGDAAATPQWTRWGRYAMFAGAAGAVAAAGAGVYSQRGKITAGLGWVGSHLEFVGCLARGEELRQRVEKVSLVAEQRDLNITEFYTMLGKGATDSSGKVSEGLVGTKQRTFVNLPRSQTSSALASTTKTRPERSSPAPAPNPGGNPNPENQAASETASGARDSVRFEWRGALNEKAKDEAGAHVSMFFPRDNPGFYALLKQSAEVVGSSVISTAWYEAASPGVKRKTGEAFGGGLRSGDGMEEDEFETVGGEKDGDGEADVDWDGEGEGDGIDIVGHGDARAKGDSTVEEDVEGDAVMVSSITEKR
jgi:pimeloyl-ACP methyl ester carboxylesterase